MSGADDVSTVMWSRRNQRLIVIITTFGLFVSALLWFGRGGHPIHRPIPFDSFSLKDSNYFQDIDNITPVSLPKDQKSDSSNGVVTAGIDTQSEDGQGNDSSNGAVTAGIGTQSEDQGNDSSDGAVTAGIGTQSPDTQGSPPPVMPQQTSIPFMGNYNCSTKLCTEFLTPIDRKKMLAKTPQGAPHFYGTCHFMKGAKRSIVMLVSFEGSGNTWVRGLLEQATGICTGSHFNDKNLRRGGFNGEGIESGNVLVTKSHRPAWALYRQSRAGILILRNPLEAYVANYNRIHTGENHVGTLPQHMFGNNSKWNKYVHDIIHCPYPWLSYFQWLVTGLQTGRRVLVVRYEVLKSDLMTQVKRMLEFLGVPYSDEALQRRMSNDYEKFHRPHNNSTDFDHYTPEQRERIKGLVKQAIQFLKSNNHGITYGIEEYL